jgi:UDP-N-acetylmuramoyl-tripeptide--D-alanyl-D-alanine ligase
MRKLIELKLRILAKLILKNYHPEIIGVTGSVGKTSTKEAIYTVLKARHSVRRNLKNYNNEIGLPLTIIGSDSPGKNLFGWLVIFLKVFKLLLVRDESYPKILVLEMGVDRPGDMEYLTDIARPDIGVITLIGTVHAENFGSRVKLVQEKSKLVQSISKDGWAVINYDNDDAKKIMQDSKVKVISYGFDEKAQMRASDVVYSYAQNGENNLRGINFKFLYKGSVTPAILPCFISRANVFSALAAAAVGVVYDMNMLEISEALKNLTPAKGRMNLIEGIKHTMVIDDSYNAEPESMQEAVSVLKSIPVKAGARRFAVLGDMLELGKYSEEKHNNVGKYLAQSGIDFLITVGEPSRDIGRGAREVGMNDDRIFHFSKSEEAGLFVQERIKEGDLILVKGSQGSRMEKIVKELMADPLKAGELLVRQEDKWTRE